MSNPLSGFIASGPLGPNTGIDFSTTDYPKFAFNFTVQFVLRDLNLDQVGGMSMSNFTLAAKTASRPKINVRYEEANFYNFRTNIATRTEYGTATITFYDDGSNFAHDIIHKYIELVSPISKQTEAAADNFDMQGFESSASYGPYGQDRHGPIKNIKLAHHYKKNGKTHAKTIYNYLNPKFTSMEFSDLDMSVSDVSLVTITFNYDAVHIEEQAG